MMIGEWMRRLVGTLVPGRSDRDLERELRSHLEFAEDEAARQNGTPAGAARRMATLQSGGLAQAMERLRDQRGLPWLADLARDLRYAFRMLAASPGFTVVSILSLAIGIGVTCAVFSFADALLLRPLPVARAADVVTVGSPGTARRVLVASYRDYVDIAARATSFDGMVAFAEAPVRLAAEAGALPRAGIGLAVSGNFFGVMGAEPSLGRAFRSDEDQVPGRDAVVVLTHDFWTRELGANASILGRIVHLNGIAFTVVGIAPPDFDGLDRYTHYQFFVPMAMWPRLLDDPALHPLEVRDFRSATIKGRLKNGVTMAKARAEISVIGRDLERTYPDTNQRQDLLVRTELQDRLAESPQIGVLMVMLALLAVTVLLVACANVGGLLASRAPTRVREIALRLAIGAGRGRVVRQLFTESAFIALLGAACGLGVAYAGVLLFRQWRIPTDLPISASFVLDRRALAVSVVVALVSAAACGLGPAFQLARTDLTTAMKTTEAAGFGRRRQWTRAVMVGAQVSISVVLLVVAASSANTSISAAAPVRSWRLSGLRRRRSTSRSSNRRWRSSIFHIASSHSCAWRSWPSRPETRRAWSHRYATSFAASMRRSPSSTYGRSMRTTGCGPSSSSTSSPRSSPRWGRWGWCWRLWVSMVWWRTR
jgi:predicted permease